MEKYSFPVPSPDMQCMMNKKMQNQSQIAGFSNGTLKMPLARPFNVTELGTPQKHISKRFVIPESAGDCEESPRKLHTREEFLRYAKEQRKLRKEKALASAGFGKSRAK